MNAPIRLAILVVLVAPCLSAQQGQPAGFWTANGPNHIHNNNAGRVGIGTANPTAKLDSLALRAEVFLTTFGTFEDGTPALRFVDIRSKR